MTKYFTDNWDNIQNFKARPDDIVIASYPKAGRICIERLFFCAIVVCVFSFLSYLSL